MPMGISDAQRQAIADKFAGERCTLDGKEAKITGRLAQFATVAQLNGPVMATFAWITVERRMEQDKAFKSD